MQVTRIFAAAALSLAAVGAMAQEIDRSPTQPAFASQRTRAAVRAEAQNARAEGASHWASGGELNDATLVAPVQDQAATTSRQAVHAELAVARAAHQLPRTGEL